MCTGYDVNDLSSRLRFMKVNSMINMSSSPYLQKVVCADILGKKLEKNVNMVDMTITPPYNFKLSLPLGSSVVDDTTSHTINIPAIEPIQPPEYMKIIPKLLSVMEVDAEHRKVFDGVKTFNLIQSATFFTAYRTDENMLVCAPTGSGKTFIALLCILHELHYFNKVEDFKKTPYKIVYIAPMKALAGEVVDNFRKRLSKLNLTVREFTGDIHLRAHEIHDTDILVTTPEKWDTVTRRNTGDESLFRLVQLLIIDEVHLLNCDRGPVLEAIVARTFGLRKEGTSRLRMIGLSATLPNYTEISEFLHVKPDKGLFYFNWGFRPIPLKTTFVGSKNYRFEKHFEIEDRLCYKKVIQMLQNGQKVLIFVLSRAKALNTALYIEKRAKDMCDDSLLKQDHGARYKSGLEILEDSSMKLLKRLYESNLSCHHAGMLRDDRIRVETLFREGLIKVLVSTTTLAWGVNLPAYAVIIKGTRYYNPSRSAQAEIDLLEAQQMFGRAGRPQYDSMGEACLITNQINLPYYLSLFHWQIPIQSQFIDSLVDHLNAEIVLNTVTSVSEGVEWLKKTFLYIRMLKQPEKYQVIDNDVMSKCCQLIEDAVKKLEAAGMAIFDKITKSISCTDIGVIASHTYINRATIEIVNTHLQENMTIHGIIFLLTKSKEYGQIKVRPIESRELFSLASQIDGSLLEQYWLSVELRKIAILIYSHINRFDIADMQLYLDQIYIVQDARRILRAYFEISVLKKFASTTFLIGQLQKCLEHKCLIECPLLQFKHLNLSVTDDLFKLLKKYSLTTLKSLSHEQLVSIVNSGKLAYRLKGWIKSLPFITSTVTCYRMTPLIVRVQVVITPDFEWNSKYNSELEPWIMWIINPLKKELFPPHRFSINEMQAFRGDTSCIDINVIIDENDKNIPNELVLHMESERWMGIEVDHKLLKQNFLPTDAKPSFVKP